MPFPICFKWKHNLPHNMILKINKCSIHAKFLSILSLNISWVQNLMMSQISNSFPFSQYHLLMASMRLSHLQIYTDITDRGKLVTYSSHSCNSPLHLAGIEYQPYIAFFTGCCLFLSIGILSDFVDVWGVRLYCWMAGVFPVVDARIGQAPTELAPWALMNVASWLL